MMDMPNAHCISMLKDHTYKDVWWLDGNYNLKHEIKKQLFGIQGGPNFLELEDNP